MSEMPCHWIELWNEKAKGENPLSTMGRGGYSWPQWFLYMKDIVNKFGDFAPTDNLLDAGGGAGYTAIYFSPWVRKICCFDYAEEMVKRANDVCSSFPNIHCYKDSVPDFEETKRFGIKFEKIFLGSVIKYLPDYDSIRKTLLNIKALASEKAVVLIAHNPDIQLREQHLTSYSDLSWPKEKIARALEIEKQSLWTKF